MNDTFYKGQRSDVAIGIYNKIQGFKYEVIWNFLSSIFFPLSFVVLYFHKLKTNLILKYTWSIFAVAILVFLLFVETGPRAEHGNFIWQTIMSNYLLFTVSSVLFTSIALENHKNLRKSISLSNYLGYFRDNANICLKDLILSIVFALHILSGVAYIYFYYAKDLKILFN